MVRNNALSLMIYIGNNHSHLLGVPTLQSGCSGKLISPHRTSDVAMQHL